MTRPARWRSALEGVALPLRVRFESDEQRILRSGLFDPAFYAAAHGLHDIPPQHRLRHYLAVGAPLGFAPHPLFDADFYRQQGKSPQAAANPLLHYLREGSSQGLRPNRRFDPRFYRAANQDVRLSGFEPLTHYATRGQREQRSTEAGQHGCAPHPGGAIAVPVEPSEGEWRSLPPPCDGLGPPVDVVIPVYAGRAETLRTIHRVLSARNRRAAEMVLIDDACRDPAITGRLHWLANAGRITLLGNPLNLGFVASANRGMALHSDRDVILLNADTEVFDGWIDRLCETVERSPVIGTATPWASDATILSYPIRLRPNESVLERPDAEIDRIAASLPVCTVDLPTGVGCCMYIRRACLAQIGLFDAVRFGRGYGEENDFCQRAIRAGWRNVAASTVFIRHHGGRSFGAEKSERVRAALAVLGKLHPHYLRIVTAFNRTDPLQPDRQAFDEARVRAAAQSYVLADAPARRADAEDMGRIIASPAVGPFYGQIELWCDRVPITPNLPPLARHNDTGTLVTRIAALNICAVEISGPDSALTTWLEGVARTCGLALRARSP